MFNGVNIMSITCTTILIEAKRLYGMCFAVKHEIIFVQSQEEQGQLCFFRIQKYGIPSEEAERCVAVRTKYWLSR